MRRPFLALALAVSGGLVLAAPAHADTALHYDQIRDVKASPLGEEQNLDPAPDRLIGDITRTRITLDEATLHVAVYYRALPRAGIVNGYVFRIKTPTRERWVNVSAKPGNWAGTLTMRKPYGSARLSTTLPPDPLVSCKGTRYLIEYSHKRIVLDVPTACLGNPSFVRVGTSFSSISKTQQFIDDGYNNDGLHSDGLTLSPAVHAFGSSYSQ